MRLITHAKNTTTEQTIHGFQVIGRKVKISIEVGRKTTKDKTNFKETIKTEVELEEDTITLGKNMEVRIMDGKKTLFYYDSYEPKECTHDDNMDVLKYMKGPLCSE